MKSGKNIPSLSLLLLCFIFLFSHLSYGSEIHTAIQNQDLQQIKELLQGNSGLIEEKHLGYPPLLYALIQPDIDVEIIRLLLSYNPNLDAKDPGGGTPILRAYQTYNEAIFKLIFNLIPDAATDESVADCFRYIAFQSGKDTALLKLMREKGVKDDIFTASSLNDLEKMKQLISNNPGLVNSQLPDGRAPLHFAVYAGHPEATRLLIEAGADVNVQEKGGKTPLRYARYQTKLELIKLLFENGADLNIMDEWGKTILHDANIEPELAEFLLNNGAATNPEGGAKSTPLHSAVFMKNLELVKLLVKHGADTSVKDGFDRTPHEVAAKDSSRKEIAEFLLNASQ